MNVEKQPKSEDKTKDTDDQSLEHLHHNLFDHPSDEQWSATRSLVQPSFLKQIKSRGGVHSRPVEVSPVISDE